LVSMVLIGGGGAPTMYGANHLTCACAADAPAMTASAVAPIRVTANLYGVKMFYLASPITAGAAT
jgi:hypothetical protein